MHILRPWFLFCAIAMLLAIACGASKTALDEEDDGTMVSIEDRDHLEVALKGNPTTGYNWYVAEIDESILTQDGDTKFKPDSDGEGSSGVVTLRFVAIEPGTTPLKLVYRLENDDDAAATRTWQITVEVSE